MKALITGASSGIGRDIAHYLDSLGYELILVGRDKERLEVVKNKCKKASIVTCDLSNPGAVHKLYQNVKEEEIDILVNNAGFGLFGYFNETDLDRELEMINVNVMALHILSKYFLKDMMKKNKGYILNVSSSAGFMSGPYLSTYYATKNYVLRLTMAIYEELRRQKSNVKISALCPGPVRTNFFKVAGGKFKLKTLSSEYVAKYAIDKMFKEKMIIVPGSGMRASLFFIRLMPHKLLLKIAYTIQKKKTE